MKNKIAIIAILTGAIILILQIAVKTEEYYLKSAGVLLLMGGLFFLNTRIPSVNSEKEEIHEDKKGRK